MFSLNGTVYANRAAAMIAEPGMFYPEEFTPWAGAAVEPRPNQAAVKKPGKFIPRTSLQIKHPDKCRKALEMGEPAFLVPFKAVRKDKDTGKEYLVTFYNRVLMYPEKHILTNRGVVELATGKLICEIPPKL
jgi:hypothetical protein